MNHSWPKSFQKAEFEIFYITILQRATLKLSGYTARKMYENTEWYQRRRLISIRKWSVKMKFWSDTKVLFLFNNLNNVQKFVNIELLNSTTSVVYRALCGSSFSSSYFFFNSSTIHKPWSMDCTAVGKIVTMVYSFVFIFSYYNFIQTICRT